MRWYITDLSTSTLGRVQFLTEKNWAVLLKEKDEMLQ